MKKIYYLLLLSLTATFAFTQPSNIIVTNPEAHTLLLGEFSPEDYLPSTIINHPEDVVDHLIDKVSPDSLKGLLEVLSSFENRNTGSDTISTTFGMGAARRWAHSYLQNISSQNEDRLIVSYLQFNQNVCEMGQHRNVFAILPGIGPQRNEFILVEGHMDSRCEDDCDVNCIANGVDDNGSGTALVLEIARVMSPLSFNRSVIFMVTTGEEQGLIGAEAFAEFCKNEDVDIKAVFNNDIVGGIVCGQTASPPGCPGLNDIDSINVRVYSAGITNSRNKNLARFSKLEYLENVADLIPVKTVINIMSPEDRTGRGGDHIPFRERGYTAIRFTSANEHGNGNPNTSGDHDRQHSVRDILGEDTDTDGLIDSFFVDFNYLARNAIINGNAMAAVAMGPMPPADFNVESVSGGYHFEIDDPNDYGLYRVAVRSLQSNEWDSVYTFTNTTDTIRGLDIGLYAITAATVDSNGIESLFSRERVGSITTDTEELLIPANGLTLLQNRPNPFDEATTFGVMVHKPVTYQKAEIVVHDIQGKELVRYRIQLNLGLNEVMYDYGHHQYHPGTYAYSLVVDGQLVETKYMVYAY